MIERIVAPCFFLGITVAAGAQVIGGGWEQGFEFVGLKSYELAGTAVSAYGDWDGDGVEDVLVGAPWAGSLLPNEGAVYVLSGVDGSTLFEIRGPVSPFDLGSSLGSIADLDGDGWREILAGAPTANAGAGAALVYSGRTGSVLYRLDGAHPGDGVGSSVAAAGDVDGDGFEDWLSGAPGADPSGLSDAGSVHLVSGANGSLIRQFDGDSRWGRMGSVVSGLEDLDGDGVGDVAGGGPHTWNGASQEVGAVSLWSGATGSRIWSVLGDHEFGSLGFSLAGTGDVDGDGVPDLLVGEPWAPSAAGRTSAGALLVLSGADGGELRRQEGHWMGAIHGFAVAGVGDVDGDGTPDHLCGSPGAKPGGVETGAVYLYSGADGALLHRFEGPKEGDGYGRSLADAGDLDGNGFADLLIGAPRSRGTFPDLRGFVHLQAFRGYLDLSSSQLSASAGPPADLAIDFPDREAGVPFVVLASLSGPGPTALGGVEVPLTADLLLRSILNGRTHPALQGGRGRLDPLGDAQATLRPHPALGILAGRTLWLAAVSVEPGWSSGRTSSVARSLLILA